VPADVLDAWFPPAPSVVEALRDDPAWIARTAPPTNADALRAALADTHSVPEACLALGAGSSDLIFRAFTAWLAPDVRALVPDPTYGEYAHVLERVVGARVDRFELPRDRGFALDVHAWADRVAEGGYDVAVLVNPNNPTGSVVEREALIAALERIPTTTLVWIDEAYSCYAPQPTSVITHAPWRPGLVVCRSLSKAYALSGLRIAIACASEDLAQELRARTPPWIVGLPAQVAAIAALGEGEYYAARHKETAELRERLVDRLRRLGFAVSTGCLNAVLVRLPAPLPDAATVTHLARREGVFVRDLTGLSAAFPGRTIRVAVRSDAENERIAEVLARIVERAR
jgi:histidinol-phosphate/aromatic aminotransferase/cobyric acid decarboxylase-like protein